MATRSTINSNFWQIAVADVNGNVTGLQANGDIGAGGNITANGNMTADFFIGDGSQLINVTANSINGPLANVIITGGNAGEFLQTVDGNGTLAWAAISTAGISNGTSNVSIPVAGGDVITSVGGVANVVVVSSTGSAVTGTLSATDTVTGGNLSTAGNTSTGNLSVTGLTDLGDVANVTITGGFSGQVLTTNGAGNLSWSSINGIANGTSNVNIPVANGNVTVGVGGTPDVLTVTNSGANVTGTVTATDTVTGGNLTTAGLANVGSLAVTGVSTLGDVGNVKITGGGNGQYLQTNGSGDLVWANVTLSNISNGTSNVSIPAADGVVTTSVGGVANVLVVTTTGANLSGDLVVSNTVTAVDAALSGNVVATNNVQANGSVITDTVTGLSGAITITPAAGNNNINLTPTGTGNIVLGGANGSYITNLQLNPQQPNDAASKYYVDAVAQGLQPKEAVKCATTADLGGTYNNGTAGVGATISVAGGISTIDGYTLGATDRVLVKDQATPAENGIYSVTSLGTPTVFTRTADFDTPAEMTSGSFVFDTNKALGYVQISPDVVTVGTSAVQFSQQSAAISYTAGPGLTLANTTFFVSNTGVANGAYGNANAVATFTVDDRGQLTVANSVPIDFANANVLTANYANYAGNVTVAAQPNITSVGTLTALTVNGNTNLGPVGNITITGGNANNVLTTDGLGVLSWADATRFLAVGLRSGGNVNIPA